MSDESTRSGTEAQGGGTQPTTPLKTPAGHPDVPRQLPPAVPDFTGRADKLDVLTRILDEASGTTAPGSLVIAAVTGTAGVGKTALALRWAHQVSYRFPDGQLHVNLRGFDPSGTPVPPADAVRGFLDALGVPPEGIPRSADAQVGLYRGLLADQRTLILLDNARDEQQVRPLLPASPGSLVLVTSRNQLTGLAVSEGARVLTLETLTSREAIRLLTARVGRRRAAQERGAVSEIARLCAGLPLALSVAGARVAARPSFPLSALAAELRDAAGRLDALDAGDPQASVQAVFSWSSQQLTPEAARTFRLLGLHPGPDVSVAAAASLSGADPAGARVRLRELTRDCLIAEHEPGRYAFHDLLRAYAGRLARDAENEAERTAALERLLDQYSRTARGAAVLLYPSQEMIEDAREAPEASPFADRDQALTWLEAERPNLIASVSLAAESGFDRYAWRLPWFLSAHLARRGFRNERVALLRTALDAAGRLEDRAGQAIASRLLATAYVDLDEQDQALEYYKASVELYQQTGNRVGEAKAWHGVANVAGRLGHYTEALGYFDYVLRIQRELGHKSGEAKTLISMGGAYGGRGDMGQAQEFCRRALSLATELGNSYIETRAWHGIAFADQVLGNLTQAVTGFQHTLDAARTAGDRVHEADALAHLGDIRHTGGDTSAAWDPWSAALAIFNEIQHPAADHIRAQLTRPEQSGTSRPSRLPWCALVRYGPQAQKPATDTVQLRRIDP